MTPTFVPAAMRRKRSAVVSRSVGALQVAALLRMLLFASPRLLAIKSRALICRRLRTAMGKKLLPFAFAAEASRNRSSRTVTRFSPRRKSRKPTP
jgi:hypothetical protein